MSRFPFVEPFSYLFKVSFFPSVCNQYLCYLLLQAAHNCRTPKDIGDIRQGVLVDDACCRRTKMLSKVTYAR